MASDYKVLYRKYRPKSFLEVVGQKYTIEMLKNAIIANKISHAYIFTGPRGTGKTSTAKIFAKTINCENPKNGIPCGTCYSCQNIQNNADIIEIDAASNNGVDAIRELINNVKISPTYSKYKVYIIDEVHMLSQSAFNALLLTLEEPPSHVVFILATTNIESVPITILSRCQRYDFKKLSDDELINHLKKISEKEKINITDEAIMEIAYLSEGGCRDALSILNQLSTSNDIIDLNVVLKNYGSVSMIQIKNIVSYYINNQFEEIKDIFDNLDKSSLDYKVFLKKLIDELFLEAINYKVKGKQEKYLKVKETIFELNDLINKININIDAFLLIFLIIVKDIEPNKIKDNTSDKDTLENSANNKQEESIEESTNDLNFEKEEEKQNEKVINNDLTNEDNKDALYLKYLEQLKKVRINNCFASADKALLLDFKDKWEKFINSSDVSTEIKSIIIDSTLVLASNNINIVVDVQPSIVDMFNHNISLIEENYKKVIQKDVSFIALTVDEWDKYKEEYIKKKKEKFEYKILEEPSYQQEKSNIDNNIDSKNSDYNDILSMFDKEHIEIK